MQRFGARNLPLYRSRPIEAKFPTVGPLLGNWWHGGVEEENASKEMTRRDDKHSNAELIALKD